MASTSKKVHKIYMRKICLVCAKAGDLGSGLERLFPPGGDEEEIKILFKRAFDQETEYDKSFRVCFSCGSVMRTLRAFSNIALITKNYIFNGGPKPSPGDIKCAKNQLIGTSKDISHKFQCNICQARYTKTSLLRDHLRKHTGVVLNCQYCDQTFKCKKFLAAHILRYHNDQCKFECQLCKFKGLSLHSLKIHIANMHGKEFSLQNAFIMKDNEEVEGSKFECDFCGVKKITKSILQRHIEYFHMSTNIPCKFCKKVCTGEHGYKTHLVRVHPEECENQCAVCKNGFLSAMGLRRHLWNTHNIADKNAPQVPRKIKVKDVKPYSCEICKESFFSEGQKELHKRVTHHAKKKLMKAAKDNAKKPPAMKPKSKKKMPFSCEQCGERFKSEGHLKFHQKESHLKNHQITHTEDRPYSCNICKKSFKRDINLRAHLNSVHLNLKNFKCEYCDNAYEAKRNLEKHLLNVHGIESLDQNPNLSGFQRM